MGENKVNWNDYLPSAALESGLINRHDLVPGTVLVIGASRLGPSLYAAVARVEEIDGVGVRARLLAKRVTNDIAAAGELAVGQLARYDRYLDHAAVVEPAGFHLLTPGHYVAMSGQIVRFDLGVYPAVDAAEARPNEPCIVEPPCAPLEDVLCRALVPGPDGKLQPCRSVGVDRVIDKTGATRICDPCYLGAENQIFVKTMYQPESESARRRMLEMEINSLGIEPEPSLASCHPIGAGGVIDIRHRRGGWLDS